MFTNRAKISVKIAIWILFLRSNCHSIKIFYNTVIIIHMRHVMWSIVVAANTDVLLLRWKYYKWRHIYYTHLKLTWIQLQKVLCLLSLWNTKKLLKRKYSHKHSSKLNWIIEWKCYVCHEICISIDKYSRHILKLHQMYSLV